MEQRDWLVTQTGLCCKSLLVQDQDSTARHHPDPGCPSHEPHPVPSIGRRMTSSPLPGPRLDRICATTLDSGSSPDPQGP
ncbi:hypothetical protein E2562_017244 [Oryza meyeriana var. granulata]|uniref:Uncharacterized protein n=1 Tax=Oryza meyeriana var. granulata TaxID=110450 RepID=A0A6G1ELL4_9ORYZ|nr:hypothetical protein E2562_017244 [Oryza meyeriana var. granulata]